MTAIFSLCIIFEAHTGVIVLYYLRGIHRRYCIVLSSRHTHALFYSIIFEAYTGVILLYYLRGIHRRYSIVLSSRHTQALLYWIVYCVSKTNAAILVSVKWMRSWGSLGASSIRFLLVSFQINFAKKQTYLVSTATW